MRHAKELCQIMPQLTGKENPTDKDVLEWFNSKMDKNSMVLRVNTMIGDEAIFVDEIDAKTFIEYYKQWMFAKQFGVGFIE